MGLVSKSIPNLINGVSQQPPSLRLDSQGEVQENGFSDVVDGLKKRPPTQFIRKFVKVNSSWSDQSPNLTDSNTDLFNASELEYAFYHTYKRSDDEIFTVVITDSSTTTPTVTVYDIEGRLCYQSGVGSWTHSSSYGTFITVNSDNVDYVASTTNKNLTATSVSDYTFLVNKNKTVEKDAVISNPKTSHDALVYLKSINYGRKYQVNFKPDGLTPTQGNHTAPKHVTTTVNAGDQINNDALKVSNAIEEIRSELVSGVLNSTTFVQKGTLDTSSDHHAGGTAYPASTVLTYQTLSNLPSSPTLTSSTAQVVVGGATIPYDASGTNGWKFSTPTTIVLPQTTVQHVYQNKKWWLYRPSTSVNRIGTVGTTTTILPTTYGQEPFFIISSPSTDFSIDVTDDDGGINFKAFKSVAKSFTDLPNQCIDGFRLGVVGDNQKKEDDFYVKYEGNAGSGFWRESTGYNQQDTIKKSTMPHTLRQNDDLSFTFGEGEWADRKAGDDNTNAFPSFIDSKINDVFFHRNRLAFLAGENVIFSEASSYFNFFRTTVRSLLDSDPIDVAVSQNEVSELKAAVPIQDNLLLFSSLSQFTLSSSQLLTPAEVTIDQSTKYECDLTATPIGSGTSVFFGTKASRFAGVREFVTKDDTELKDALNITSHIPQYISGSIRKFAASPNEDMLLALSTSPHHKKVCYVYKWHDSAQERLQSSWSKWIFKEDILDVFFTNSIIYFIFADGSFQKIDLTNGYITKLLDNQVPLGQNTPTGQNLPRGYSAGANDGKIAITSGGFSLGSYDHANPTAEQQANLSNGNLFIGDPYTFKYQLSEQVFEPAKGDPTQLSRFQLRKISFNYNDSGHFDVTVDSVGRTPVTAHFTGRVLDSQHNLLDESAIIDDGAFQVAVQSQATNTAITITNDSHLPSIFQSAEWEGYIVLRNQRL